MHLGAAYYPEHWPEDRWETDAQLMKEAGLTVVRMGEFAWSRMEPRRDRYQFDWLQRAVSVMGKHDIRTVLCTPTATPPAWLVDRHPSILPQGPDRIRKSFGARRHYCANNGPYRKYTRRIVTQLCEAFRDNPHVIGWQIDNEFGCHDTARCYCDDCTNAFRTWLRARYGSVERLNDEWGTVFWSQEYGQWHQIPLPWNTIGGDNRAHSPSLVLDFYRFSSDSQVDYQQLQASIIRGICPSHFVTHNMMGLFDQIDYYDLAKDLDLVSWDNYPGTGADPARVALAHDVMRGVKGQNFWVMEEQSGATGWYTNSPTPRPGQIRLWSYQAIAHGADAVVFFRWRTCRFGTEEYWHGILNHDGVPGRRYQEVARLGQELAEAGDAWQDAGSANRVAMLMGYDVLWAHQLQPHSAGFNYWSHFRRYYDALHRMGVGVDVVRPGQDLEGYKLVIAPALYLVSPTTREGLRSYVKAGGALVTTFRSFVKNLANVVGDTTLPIGVDDVLGILVPEYDALPSPAPNSIRMTSQDQAYGIRVWADLISLQGAQALAEYESDFYAGTPAVTVNTFGIGKAYYVGTWPEEPFHADFLAQVVEDLGIPRLQPGDADVEVVRRETEDAEIVFYLNHRPEPVDVPVEREATRVLDGQAVSGNVTVEPYGVLIVTRPR